MTRRASDYLETAETHTPFNLPEPLQDYNAFSGDQALQASVLAFGAGLATGPLRDYGAHTGSAAMLQLGFLANAHPPRLHTHSRFGERRDQVEYHPAYHELMRDALVRGLHAGPWLEPGPGAHVRRAAQVYLQTQVEQGHGCPLTMTFASVPVLRKQPSLAEIWLPKVLANNYDPRDLPITHKAGATIGMAMTEKQGGSDVRSNTTHASPLVAPGPGQCYHLVGHKYFMSAPMSDAFLMLAQTRTGLSCFLVPRWCADGARNRLHIQRLKAKLGNVSNASAEVELRAAEGWLVGEEGRGVATIIEMVALTRFDCLLASAAAMRQASVQALHHCRQRSAFGKRLIAQPLMCAVLADLAIESEAALWLAMRMASALDHPEDPDQRHLLRLGTALGKYWVCKRTPGHNYEAMECLGGTGVMEDGVMARLYREAPINAIWEGSGNVQCLDVLRTLQRSPEIIEALFRELQPAVGRFDRLDQQIAQLDQWLALPPAQWEAGARSLVERLALVWQGALLARHGHPEVARGFIAGRLGQPGLLYGALPAEIDTQAIVDWAWPEQPAPAT